MMTGAIVKQEDNLSGTSSTLLEQVRRGEEVGWHRLIDLYTPLVYRWCRSWGLQPADAENVGQEVFTAVARKLMDFRRNREGDSFRAWLRTITRNKFTDHMRRGKREAPGVGGSDAQAFISQISAESSQLVDEGTLQEQEEVGFLYEQALRIIREEFSQRDWQLFAGVVLEGKSSVDVAERFQVTLNMVYLAKSRILSRLRSEFAEVIGAPLP